MTASATALVPATRWIIAALVSAAATATTATATRSLIAESLRGLGTSALMSGALSLISAAASILCLYLLVVSVLAALAHSGMHHGVGRSSLRLLRRIAPSVARRVALGMATASAVTGLALAPALAADSDLPTCADSMTSSADASCSTAADSSPGPEGHDVVTPSPSELPAPSPTEGDHPGTDSGQPPPLGWTATPPDADPQRTVVVRPGDTLWSITDDVLGPGTDDPSQIQRSWPQLHERNLEVIGSDPDTIHPGQVLVIPAGLGSDDAATSTPEE